MIYLLWCTANPEIFKTTYLHWMENAVHEDNIGTFVAVDNEEHAEILKDHYITVVDNPRHGFTTPLYALSSQIKANYKDIIVVPSDDFYAPVNWDTYLVEQLKEYDGYFKVNDGHRKNIISMPVMTYSGLLKTNKIIYHPAYTHMYSDQELHDVLEEMKILKVANNSHPEFEHKHYSFGKRKKMESDLRVINYWDESYQLYLQRKKMKLDDKLII